MDIIMFVLFFLAFVVTPVSVYVRNRLEPYSNGTKQIDPIKYPTLARAQRIIRANNTKRREIEATTKFNYFETKRLEVETAIEKAIKTAREESQDKHLTAIYAWDTDFANITREREEEERRAKEAAEAEARKQQEAARAAIREKELAIWTANEKARLARFEAEQRALQAEEDRKVAALLEDRERAIESLSKHRIKEHGPGNQHLCVTVHGLFVRKLPTKSSRIVDNLTQNSWVTVNGWIAHEEVYGNPIWFRLANGEGWIWSGGVNSQSTTGLENLNYLNEPGDTFVTKSADGVVHQTYSTPSELEQMYQQELELLKKEKRQLQQIKREVPRLTDKVELLTPKSITELVLDGTTPDFWRGTQFSKDRNK